MTFHPAVSGWLTQRFGRPTEVQTQAWAVTSEHCRHVLIAAPTGSGKTLAAFLAAIDALVRLGRGQLRDETRVVYISPLKALSNDIHRNLEEPLAGIRQELSRWAIRTWRFARWYAPATRPRQSAAACGAAHRTSW